MRRLQETETSRVAWDTAPRHTFHTVLIARWFLYPWTLSPIHPYTDIQGLVYSDNVVQPVYKWKWKPVKNTLWLRGLTYIPNMGSILLVAKQNMFSSLLAYDSHICLCRLQLLDGFHTRQFPLGNHHVSRKPHSCLPPSRCSSSIAQSTLLWRESICYYEGAHPIHRWWILPDPVSVRSAGAHLWP